MLRVAARSLAAIGLLVFFLVLAAGLQARRAINDGALDKPWRCLNAQHYDRYRAGRVAPERMDWWIAERVRDVHLGGRRVTSGEWHLRGGWAYLGVRASYDQDRRREMAMKLIKLSDLCPQDREKYRRMKGFP